jgi:hypothetical protein
MWLLAVRRKTTLAIEKCQKELEVLKEQRRKLEELEVQRRKLKQILEEYKNGLA